MPGVLSPCRCLFVCCSLAGTLGGLIGCGAEPLPDERPLKIVVPFGPGGGSDAYARIIQKGIDDNNLSKQPIVIINRDGAGATLGSRYVKEAKPDGNTVLFLHEAIVTARYSGNVRYGPEAFEPIAATGSVAMVIAVMEDSPHASLSELMEAARAEPNTLAYANNFGAPVHFLAKQLERAVPGAAFKFTQSGGGTTRFHHLSGGHVDVSAFSLAEYMTRRASGLRALAVFRPDRHPALPDLQTAREQGIDVEGENLFCWWAPKGTKPERIDELASLLGRAMETEFVRETMQAQNTDVVFYRDEAFQQQIDAMVARISSVAIREEFPVPNFPLIMGLVVGCLALACGVQAFLARNRTRIDPSDMAIESTLASAQQQTRKNRPLAVLTLVLTFAYVLAMQTGACSFSVATVPFVIGVGASLTRMKVSPRSLLILVAIALLMGVGLQYVLTKIFTIDLP